MTLNSTSQSKVIVTEADKEVIVIKESVGPTGKTGPPGASVVVPEFFTYEQLTPSDEWIIDHPLNKYPSVTLVDTAGTVLTPTIKYVSASRVILTMIGVTSGKAYLN